MPMGQDISFLVTLLNTLSPNMKTGAWGSVRRWTLLSVSLSAPFLCTEWVVLVWQIFKMEDVSMGMWVEQFNGTVAAVQYSHNWKFCQYGCMEDYFTAHYQSPRQIICLWDKLGQGHAHCCNFRWRFSTIFPTVFLPVFIIIQCRCHEFKLWCIIIVNFLFHQHQFSLYRLCCGMSILIWSSLIPTFITCGLGYY